MDQFMNNPQMMAQVQQMMSDPEFMVPNLSSKSLTHHFYL